MADNIDITPGTGKTVSTDDAGADGHVQRVKLAASADGSATHVLADANGLGVQGPAASDAAIVGSPVAVGARASTATPSDVSADGDVVFLWARRNGALVLDGMIGSGAADIGNPVKVGGRYNSTQPTLTDGQRGDAQLDTRGNLKAAIVGIDAVTGASVASTTADGAGSPNALSVRAFGYVFNGSTWDRFRGDTTNGLDVDVTRLPALPAGTNNIGDVDVLTMPVVQVGDNSGSLTVDNGGTFAVQDSEKVTDNAAFTDGTTKVQPAGFIFDESAGTALTENDAAAGRVDSKRAQVGVIEDATTRGQRAAVSAAGRLSVDASGVAVPVTDNASSLTVDAPVGTPVFVRLSDGSAAIATLPVSLASLPALAAGNNNIGDVDLASIATGQGKTLLFAVINAASSGNNTLIAAAGGSLKIKVVSYVLVADAAVTAKFQSGAGGTDLSGAMSLAANGGVSAIGSPSSHLFETAANALLNLSLGGAVGVRGHIAYFTEA